ncbi:MAG TPA: di-heme-cytochrome C peroxidase [Vicinamibacterales bacterium]|nr:di-heme-cytochrome C peroxidase [Vicinamibacterales bacterium]
MTGALSACRTSSRDEQGRAPSATAAGEPLADYHNGLSDDDRETFYHLSEGSEMIPLALLQALERPRTPQDPRGDALMPFMDNLARYGFIPDRKYDKNPAGLPIGMTVERSPLTNRVMIGFNCTACHVGELWRGGRRVRIDGGPNMVRLNNLVADTKTELDATLTDMTGRRERFLLNLARRRRENDVVFPSTRSVGERAKDLATDIDLAKGFVEYLKAIPTLKAQTATENGYGRADAFGVARNLLFGKNPENLRLQNAPVSFPHMWGIETTAWLQWGANMNSVMERNIGQSLGVGAVFNAESFAATSRLDHLNTLEHLVYKLTPPAWPEDVFGAIDRTRAARGREVYERQCANCHDKPFAITPSGLVVYQLFTPKETGVSPLVAQNFDEPVIVDGQSMRFAAAAFTVLENLKKRYYVANQISEETQAEWEGRARRPPPEWKPVMRSTLADADKYPDSRGGRVSPAKPLAGVWATAPYLNNGSVANMWDLLTPPAARPTRFTLGSREYDVKTLGYRSTPDPKAPAPPWEYNTSDTGNSNAGHVYGTTLPDDDKWALIEFLKQLRPGDIKREPLHSAY